MWLKNHASVEVRRSIDLWLLEYVYNHSRNIQTRGTPGYHLFFLTNKDEPACCNTDRILLLDQLEDSVLDKT